MTQVLSVVVLTMCVSCFSQTFRMIKATLPVLLLALTSTFAKYTPKTGRRVPQTLSRGERTSLRRSQSVLFVWKGRAGLFIGLSLYVSVQDGVTSWSGLRRMKRGCTGPGPGMKHPPLPKTTYCTLFKLLTDCCCTILVSGTSPWWFCFTWRTAPTARVWSHIELYLPPLRALKPESCLFSVTALKKVFSEDDKVQKILDEDFIVLNLVVGSRTNQNILSCRFQASQTIAHFLRPPAVRNHRQAPLSWWTVCSANPVCG